MHAGGDLINFVKQFNQSGLQGKAPSPSGLMFITDIHSLGVDQFEGTQFTDAVVLELRRAEQGLGRPVQGQDRAPARRSPTPRNYSAALNYLEAVQAAGTDNSDAVIAQLEGKKINDIFLRNGEVRKADHAVIHDVYLAKVKARRPAGAGTTRRSSRRSRPPRPTARPTPPAQMS